MTVKIRAAVGCSIMMASLLALSQASAKELDKVVFGTNWYAPRPSTAASTRPWRPDCMRNTGWMWKSGWVALRSMAPSCW